VDPESVPIGQRPRPRELFDVLGRPPEDVLEHGVQLWAMGDHHRGAGLGDEFGPQSFAFGFEGLLQLPQEMLAECVIGRPAGFAERRPGGGYGPRHVLVTAIGDASEHLLGSRVEVVELHTGRRLGEPAVNEHAAFRRERADLGLNVATLVRHSHGMASPLLALRTGDESDLPGQPTCQGGLLSTRFRAPHRA
jgi:hypothetical protein